MYQIPLLLLAGAACSFGITWLTLRRGPFRRYAFEAAAIWAPALLVLAVSVAGYRQPYPITQIDMVGLPLFGFLVTFIVVLIDRSALLNLLRDERARLTWCAFGALLAIGTFVFYHRGIVGHELLYLGNGEYINYAQLAASMLGNYPEAAGDAWMAQHRTLRFGQDIILATASYNLGLHPLISAQLVSGWMRALWAIATVLILYESGILRGKSHWIFVSVLIFAAFSSVDLFGFAASFMSANAIGAVALSLCVASRFAGSWTWREVLVSVGGYTYFLVTYPELVPVLKGWEFFLVAVWICSRQSKAAGLVLLATALTALVHPVQWSEKLKYISAIAQSPGAGWNIFGDPRQDLLLYFQHLFSLRMALVDGSVTASIWQIVPNFALLVAAGAFLIGLISMWQRRTTLREAIGFWVLSLIVLNVMPLISKTYLWYAAVKFWTQTSFFLPLSYASVIQGGRSRLGSVGRIAAVIWLGASAITFVLSSQAAWERGRALGWPMKFPTIDSGEKVLIVSGDNAINWYLNLLVTAAGSSPMVLSEEDKYWLARRPITVAAQSPSALRAQQSVDSDPVLGAWNTAAIGWQGQILIDRKLLSSDGRRALVDRGMLEIQLGEILWSSPQVVWARGKLAAARSVKFSETRWLLADDRIVFPEGTTRVELIGELPSYTEIKLPLTVTMTWEGGQTERYQVSDFGRFELATTAVPQDKLGQARLQIHCDQAFVPSLVNPKSPDTRRLCLVLSALQITNRAH